MCGLIGLSGKSDLVSQLMVGMFHLFHRGQQGFGVIKYEGETHQLYSMKSLHPWGSSLQESEVRKSLADEGNSLSSSQVVLGHTRYPTFGHQTVHELQPFISTFPYAFTLAHNGNILNYQECCEKFKTSFIRQSTSDSELLFFLLQYFLHQQTNFSQPSGERDPQTAWESLQQAIKLTMEQVQGSYACIGFWGPVGLFAFRDPHGVRPLSYGRHPVTGDYGVCSESGPLEYLGYDSLISVPPGSVVAISSEGEFLYSSLLQKAFRPCFFEWIYFAGPGSTLDEHSVYQTRVQLGYALGEKIFHEQWLRKWGVYPDLVAGVPDTGRTAAWSLSLALQLPFREVFFRQRSMVRSFIQSEQDGREHVVRSKFIPIKKEIEGKSILLVDDSIVRGTTSRNLARLLRQYGAKQIVLLSTSPPIRYPCFLGIDFPEKKELIVNLYEPEQLASFLEVEGVLFLDVQRLLKVFHFESNTKPCLGCVEGDYPFTLSEERIEQFSLQRHEPY